MSFTFQKATKYGSKAKVALVGPAGSGKTYSALALATRLAAGGKIAVIDTEHGTASKYADRFTFDTLQLQTFEPTTYVKAIQAAEAAGYGVIVVDSLSHAWMGKGGALEQVDAAKARSGGGNSFTAWKDVTPQHNAMVEALVACKAHLIVTMRSKMEYVLETNEKGKQVPRKVGMAPVQRDGLEYEFDLVGDMDLDNNLVVTKSRCPDLSGKVFHKPDEEPSRTLMAWLEGAPAPQAPAAKPAAPKLPPLRREALEAMDMKALANEHGKRLGIELTKQEIDGAGGDLKIKADAPEPFGLGKDGEEHLRLVLIGQLLGEKDAVK